MIGPMISSSVYSDLCATIFVLHTDKHCIRHYIAVRLSSHWVLIFVFISYVFFKIVTILTLEFANFCFVLSISLGILLYFIFRSQVIYILSGNWFLCFFFSLWILNVCCLPRSNVKFSVNYYVDLIVTGRQIQVFFSILYSVHSFINHIRCVKQMHKFY